MVARVLNVNMNGFKVGKLKKTVAGGLSFSYEPSWLDNPKYGRAISLSMPLTTASHYGDRVYNFFDNLLPDNAVIRANVRAKFSINSNHPFDILAVIGKDCVGAIQLYEEDLLPPNIKTIDAIPLNDAEIAATLENYAAHPLGMAEDSDFRISLAGVQEKTALLNLNGHWHQPKAATPTTHIIKLPVGVLHSAAGDIDLSKSCENEWLCLEILKAFGLPVAEAQIVHFENKKVLSVTRFDRSFSKDKSWILRKPQEDFCQAFGLPSSKKYQADGGYGIEDCLKLINGSINAKQDACHFFKAQILFWLLAASDGHLKNFSLMLEANNRYSLTPLYDVLSMYPMARHNKTLLHKVKMAMAMKSESSGNKYKWKDIQVRHILNTAKSCHLQDEAIEIMEKIIADSGTVLSHITKKAQKARIEDDILNPIMEGLEKKIRELNFFING